MNFIGALIQGIAHWDPPIGALTARDCMFRINRDIRFSKNKAPYKTNFGASINAGGRKAMNRAGYYFHLEPGGSFAGGGLYMPEPAALQQVRQEIDYDYSSLRKILAAPAFRKTFGGLDTDAAFRLSRIPKGYPADHPAAEQLRLKSFIAFAPLADGDLTEKNLLKKTLGACKSLFPLLQFLNRNLE
jgi:uncharacterized protein (TIGR02453 family)